MASKHRWLTLAAWLLLPASCSVKRKGKRPFAFKAGSGSIRTTSSAGKRLSRRREHGPSNRAWIRRLRPLITEHEEFLRERLSFVYATAWPERAIRTDVVFHANWAGAYATLYPTRITIAGSAPDQPAAEGLETLFHEASHALIGTIRGAISARARSPGRLLP